MCQLDSKLYSWATSPSDAPESAYSICVALYHQQDRSATEGWRFSVGIDGQLLHIPPGKNTPQPIKPGKMIRILFEDRFSDSQIESFVSYYRACFQMDDAYEVDILSGQDIKLGYETAHYYRGKMMGQNGTLWHSCMNDDLDYLEIYCRNPEVCRLVTLTFTDSDGERGQVARALLWNTESGETILDRIYYVSPAQETFLRRYADQQGWWKRVEMDEFMPPGSSEEVCKRFYVSLNYCRFGEYPYVDTFRYLDRSESRMCNDSVFTSYIELDDTDGEFTDNEKREVYSDYHGCYIDEEDAVYSTVVRSYLRDSDAVIINGRYYPDDHDDICEAITRLNTYWRSREWMLTEDAFMAVDGEWYSNDLIDKFVEDESTCEYIKITDLSDEHKDQWFIHEGERKMFLGGELVEEDQLLTDALGNAFKAGDENYIEVTIDDGSITGRTEYYHWTQVPDPHKRTSAHVAA